MLLSNRLTARRAAGFAALITFCLVALYQVRAWPALQPAKDALARAGARLVADAEIANATAAATDDDAGDRVPRKIWYKLGPNGLSDDNRGWIDSCARANPGYRVEYMTDASGDAYVRAKYADRRDVVDSYLGLTVPILKADFLRYLILYAEGGIWSDLDVSCEGEPIDEWVPAALRRNASVVVGWEFDEGWPGSITRQFETWTILSKPRSPHMLQVIDDIVAGIRAATAEHQVAIGDLHLGLVGDVVDFTGPRRFTTAIFKSLKATLGGPVDENAIANLYQPKLVGDVLIMPGYTFANGSNTYADRSRLGPTLVTHHYAGSWKNDQGGEIKKSTIG